MMIPTDETLIRDEDVFGALNLDYPGMEGIKATWLAGDASGAKRELAKYFETRQNVQYFFDYRALPLSAMEVESYPYAFQAAMGLHGSLKDFCLRGAKLMLEHVYLRPGERAKVDLGKNFENLIHFDFINDQGKKHRSLLDNFVRGQFFEYLAVAYHETGDSAYLSCFEQWLGLFFQNYPLKVEKTSPDADRFQYCDERDVMSVGWLVTVLANLLYTRLPYDGDSENCFELIKHIWFLGIQFRRFDTDHYRPYNHHLWERGLLPYLISMIFPEMPGFVAMKERAKQTIDRHVDEDFNEHGGYNEHSLAYLGGAALGEMLSRGILLARLNGEPLLSPACHAKISRCFDVLAAIAPPEMEYPSVGDNRAPMVQSILALGEKTCANECCAWRLQPRDAKERGPIPLAMADDLVGFACGRSDFSSNANYFLMSVKRDCGTSGHNHMDMLSLCISFHGQPIIGEPYYRLYHTIKMGSDLRGYMYNMTSHNTVLAHREPVQPNACYANRWGVFRPDSPLTHFQPREEGVTISAYHDAYTYVRHVRKLAFVAQKGLLICDEVFPGNRREAPHVQRWHLMPQTEVEPIAPDALEVKVPGVKLLFLWSNTLGVNIYRNEALYPEIMPSKAMLYPILDAPFVLKKNDQPGRPAARTVLLILDVTQREVDLDTLRLALAQTETQAEMDDLYQILCNA